MVRDIVDAAIRMVEDEHAEQVKDEARRRSVERVLDALAPAPQTPADPDDLPPHLRAMREFAAKMGLAEDDEPSTEPTAEQRRLQHQQIADAQRRAQSERERLRPRLEAGELDQQEVTIEVTESKSPTFNVWGGQGEELIRLEDALGGMMPKQTRHRTMTVAEAMEVLIREESDKLIDHDKVLRDAVNRAENDGIVFIDELDKICGGSDHSGPDVSREGVQRDILPVVEGTTVMTKHGPVDTRHMLFIAAGAFHVSKPSDLIPELQGRFPIRVELENLGQADLRRILAEPDHSLLKQYQALLGTEGVTVDFRDEAVDELATIAMRVNDQTENIGARRLHTILERLLDELSFAAPDIGETTVIITREYVQRRLSDIVADQDLSRYIL
jgi:ATP-dependent HslUV protease ATP-binding subunit HslU